MIIVDEYLALRALTDRSIPGLPDDEVLGLTYLRHWRLISTIALPGKRTGKLSKALSQCSPNVIRFIQRPNPAFIELIDPLKLNLSAASYLTVLGPMSTMFAETLAACIEYNSPLFIGEARNGVGSLADKCRQAGVEIIEIS